MQISISSYHCPVEDKHLCINNKFINRTLRLAFKFILHFIQLQHFPESCFNVKICQGNKCWNWVWKSQRCERWETAHVVKHSTGEILTLRKNKASKRILADLPILINAELDNFTSALFAETAFSMQFYFN